MLIYSLFDFRKLRIFRCFPFPENSGTLTFPISGNSGLQHFPRFSLSPDPQFPFALLYCFHLCNSDPILCTRYNSIPLLSYKYLYSVPRSSRIKITIIPIISSHSSSPYHLYLLLVSGSRNSHALSHSEIRDP